jgi:hypothetical protein
VTDAPDTTDPDAPTGPPAGATVWGEIDGQVITFPMEVAELDAATLVFSVPADAAQALVPGDAFEVIEVAPGVAQLVIALCDYRQNPWGDYLEINLGFLARPAGAPDDVVGSFVYRMPVDQAFTCKAGNEVMGFPKTVEQLSVTDVDGTVTFAMEVDGATELAISFPTAPGDDDAPRIEAVSYSYLDGVPYGTPLAMDMGTGFVEPDEVVVELGPGTVADELRTLGLPKAPDFATWGTGLSATFQLGTPVT